MKKYKLSIIMSLFLVTSLHCQWDLKTNGLPNDWNISDPLDVWGDNSAVISLRDTFYKVIYLSVDKGESWQQKETPSYWPANDISIINDSLIWFCVSPAIIYFSSDYGSNWEVQYQDSTINNCLNYIEFFDQNNGVALGDAPSADDPALVLTTQNGGKDWNVVNDTCLIGAVSMDMFYRIDFVNSEVGYFFSQSYTNSWRGLHKTTDGGKTWITIPTTFRKVHLLKFYDENYGFIIGVPQLYDPGPLYRTRDGGVSWELMENSPIARLSDLEFLPDEPSKIWYTTHEKLYFSADSGETWIEEKLQEGSLEGMNLAFGTNNSGWLLTIGKVFHTNNGDTLWTDINDDDFLVEYFDMDQNYPNPFNPSTTISFSIPQAVDVKLNVYNVLGQQVAALVNEFRNVGTYKVNWDASNMSSGIYIYRLKAGTKVLTNRMILLK